MSVYLERRPHSCDRSPIVLATPPPPRLSLANLETVIIVIFCVWYLAGAKRWRLFARNLPVVQANSFQP